MQLVLSVGNKVLDRIKLNPELLFDEDYIDAQRRLLLTKHELSIIALHKEPTFYIEAPSRINGQRNK